MTLKEQLVIDGFTIVNNAFTSKEIDNIVAVIDKTDSSQPTFRKTKDLFAIRQFFKEVPETLNFVFIDKLKRIISDIAGNDFFVVKSIYFDKPASSNWFVSYHQDLTISVNEKAYIDNFGPWTIKHNQFAVQPPVNILQDNVTLRIHLDTTNEENGALKVIAKSHTKGIYRPETIDWNTEIETVCSINKGGVMFMKPLLLHSSGRTTNNNRRRVIHVELSRIALPYPLKWSEQLPMFN